MQDLRDLVDYELERFRERIEKPGTGRDPLWGDSGRDDAELTLRLSRGAWRELLRRVDSEEKVG